jgi:ribonuclease R
MMKNRNKSKKNSQFEKQKNTPQKNSDQPVKKEKSLSKGTLTGLIKRHPDGFGFLIPDDVTHPDLYIAKHSMIGVMTNDRVKAEVFQDRGENRFRGEIVEILSRGTKVIIGKFHHVSPTLGVIPDDGSWGFDLKISIYDSKRAKEGELVAAEIISYPTDKATEATTTEKKDFGGFKNFKEKTSFTGKVTEILGDLEDPLNDIKRVLISNHIPSQFSPGTLKEAAAFSEYVEEKDMVGRKDIRDLPFITIDGVTAKDFDDAIYVESDVKGFKLYVAIADVSHYVKEGTSIDKDAYERGTSVYFPNFVVPMLPEVLSNGLCSLNPHRPRLALVAEMKMDFSGEMISSSFYEAVIESKARVTYGEAQEIIDGNVVEKLNHVKDQIIEASQLAKILMAKRFKEGSLDLEIPETELILDASGNPVDIIKSERIFSHKLIEEMMLAANVAVAKFFHEKEIPGIYRVHETPDQTKIQTLERYIYNFGGSSQLTTGKLQKKLTKVLHEFAGKPEALVLHILTLRSMAQAKYSANNVGHFGLGFEFYTHFTSPIRRYPDLIVHRLVKALVQRQKGYRLYSEDELSTSGVMLSACEQRAVKSERLFHSIKKARFMKRHLGEEFDGIISSVAKFGIFVLLRQFDIDGLVHVENLGKEKFEFDEENLRLVGTRSGASYNIGDQVKIQVVAADHQLGKIDFLLVTPESANQVKDQGVKPQKMSAKAFYTQNDKASKKERKNRRFEKVRTDKNKSSKKNKKKSKKSSSDDIVQKIIQKIRTRKSEKVKKNFKGESLDDLTSNGKTNRKNPQKRSSFAGNSEGVRKARVSQRSRKD